MLNRFARRQANATIHTQNSSDTPDSNNAPVGLHVLVYRLKKNRWEEPLTLLDMQGENCTTLLLPPSGPSEFRSTVVRRFIPMILKQERKGLYLQIVPKVLQWFEPYVQTSQCLFHQ